MNLKEIIPLVYFGLAIFIFEIMNWYGIKYVQETWIQIAKYAIWTLPFQFIAYVLLIRGLTLGYQSFGDIWSLIVTTTTIAWFIKLVTAYGFFQKLPTKGKVVALVLLVSANVIDKLWK